jgi:hypothetical protein
VNPYVSVSIAMCLIVAIALAATAYMAVYFNRRAKADLAAALQPLADVVDGAMDVDEALVKGRYSGHIAEGRVGQLAGGMGRVFHTSVIDGAGGGKWTWTVSRGKEPGEEDRFAYEGPDGELRDRLFPLIQSVSSERTLTPLWLRVEYDPAPGHIRLTKPMRTRRDIPSPATFRTHLDHLVAIADANRDVQHGHA